MQENALRAVSGNAMGCICASFGQVFEYLIMSFCLVEFMGIAWCILATWAMRRVAKERKFLQSARQQLMSIRCSMRGKWKRQTSRTTSSGLLKCFPEDLPIELHEWNDNMMYMKTYLGAYRYCITFVRRQRIPLTRYTPTRDHTIIIIILIKQRIRCAKRKLIGRWRRRPRELAHARRTKEHHFMIHERIILIYVLHEIILYCVSGCFSFPLLHNNSGSRSSTVEKRQRNATNHFQMGHKSAANIQNIVKFNLI